MLVVVKVEWIIKVEGNFDPLNELDKDQDIRDLFGNANPTLGGPTVLFDSRVNPDVPDHIGHVVELKGYISPAASLPSSQWTIEQEIEKVSVAFNYDTGLPHVDMLGDVPDNPEIYQNIDERPLFEIDAPGPGANVIFSYFGPNPPAAPNQGDRELISITVHYEMTTWAVHKAVGRCSSIFWQASYQVSGDSIEDVTSSAGERTP